MLSTVISLALFAPAASYAPASAGRVLSRPAVTSSAVSATRVPLVLMDAKVTEIMMPALSSTMTELLKTDSDHVRLGRFDRLGESSLCARSLSTRLHNDTNARSARKNRLDPLLRRAACAAELKENGKKGLQHFEIVLAAWWHVDSDL